MRAKKKRTIVIVSLCVLLLIMSAGYAAFSSVLNISGTARIAGKWQIEVIGVAVKDTSGTGENAEDPTWGGTTATVQANLYEPGDYVEYAITVQNKGTIDARLNKITFSEAADTPIKFTTSGITEGDKLLPDKTGTLNVKIEYDSTASKVTEDIESELTITLEYVQDNRGTVPPVPSGETAADKLIATAITTGDGLYADEYEEGRYVYKGSNPNNYITFNNETWRILAVESNGTLKIMRKDSIGTRIWDTSGSNNWARPSTLNTYLNNDYYNTLSSDAQGLIETHTWGIGLVTYENIDLVAQIASENGTTWTGNIGLMSSSDYLRANTNTEQCGNWSLTNSNSDTCKTTNYIVPTSGWIWTISPEASDPCRVTNVNSYGGVGTGIASLSSDSVVPTLYLIPNITLSGSGISDDPYTIVTN